MMAIALASFKEAVRKRMALLVGGLTLIYLTLYYLLVYHYAKDMVKAPGMMNLIDVTRIATQIVAIVGFYFSNMLIAFLTIMASVGAISAEIENGTAHSILSKPLKRTHYLLGKYLGLSALTVIYATMLYFAVILIGVWCKLPVVDSLNTGSIIKGLLFFDLQPVALLALAIWGSSILKTVSNGIIVISVYIFSLIGGMMEQIGAMTGHSIYLWGIFSSLIAPFDVIYRLMIAQVFSDLGIANPFMIGLHSGNTAPSIWMVVYILFYIAGLLFLACNRFARRDIA
jgi:ABC-type transport system involved in multi-copper enzyme maturation permease subunit